MGEVAASLSTAPPLRVPVVLVVDDNSANRDLIETCLANVECRIQTATDGPAAISSITSAPPDLVLLDVQISGADGYEVCRQIKAMPRGRLLPVLMITRLGRISDQVQALESGADDFMSKPVERTELVARVRAALRFKTVLDTLDTSEQFIFALAAAVESKDVYTVGHTQRVANAARHLGHRLGLPVSDLDALYRGGLMHDIGKIAISDLILLKPGPLNAGEQRLMREHPIIGERIVKPLHTAADILPIIRHHHERFDAGGYPDGLAGHRIPLLARIVSVCDAHDALSSARPYRSQCTSEEAIEILMRGAGHQWDRELVSILLSELPTLQVGIAS
jgi:putative two-component system response regulator